MWILIANQDEGVSRGVARDLEAERHRTHWARSWAEAEHSLSSGSYQTILLDPALPGLTAEALRAALRAASPRPRVILYSTTSPAELSSRAACFEPDGCLSELQGPACLLAVVAGVGQASLRSPPSLSKVAAVSAEVPPRRKVATGGTGELPASLAADSE